MQSLVLASLQGAMYKPMDIDVRAERIKEINSFLNALEGMCKGPYFVGSRFSTADAAAFPPFVFLLDMLPRYFGWPDVFNGRPKLKAWWDTVQQDEHAVEARHSA